MSKESLLKRLGSLRLRVHVSDYEGHPSVLSGTVVSAIGDPDEPNFLVIESDSPIEVPRPSAAGTVVIRHVAVSPIGWSFEMLLRTSPEPSGLLVQIWDVFNPVLATSGEWTEGAMIYVAKGSITIRGV